MTDERDPDASVDLARWFRPDELEECPKCQRRRLVRSESGSSVRVCLDCGAIQTRKTERRPPQE